MDRHNPDREMAIREERCEKRFHNLGAIGEKV